jgi:transposase-like protein
VDQSEGAEALGTVKSSTNKPADKAKRVDGQITGLAGELFFAAELLKRGLQTSVTFGNAKSVDLFAYNPETGKTFTVQVKSVRKRNAFPISHERVESNHIYVFVILNKPDSAVQYFVVPGQLLSAEPERFTKWFTDIKFPGIPPAALEPFENAWQIFHE